jgi:hypothetical protein
VEGIELTDCRKRQRSLSMWFITFHVISKHTFELRVHSSGLNTSGRPTERSSGEDQIILTSTFLHFDSPYIYSDYTIKQLYLYFSSC